MTEPVTEPEQEPQPGAWPKPAKRRGEEGRLAKREIGLQLKPLYNAGRSLRQIAEETGYSYGYVHTCLLYADVQMRPRGSNRHPGRVLTA